MTFARIWIAIMIAALPLPAHDIITTNLTYARDISRIFARRCVSCHSASSSISLTTYEEVRPWAVGIKEQVLSRSMPPWGAVKGFGNLSPDHALTQEEIMLIAAWVIGGAPQGDLTQLPHPAPEAPATPSPLVEAIVVSTRTVLARPLDLAGLEPRNSTRIDSARIVARLPDGRIEPLVWLYRLAPKASSQFRFRRPLPLPQNTIIESSAPLEFALLTARALAP